MHPRGDAVAIVLLAAGHLVVDLYQGSVPALLPLWRQAFHLPYAAAGSILLALQLSSSVVQPLFGMMGDRLQSRWVLPLAVALAGAGLAAAVLAQGLAGVMAGVVLGGLGIALYHPEGSRRAYERGGRLQATAQSGFALGGNVGMAMGPALVAAAGGVPATLATLLGGVGVVMATLLAAASRRLVPPQAASRVVPQARNDNGASPAAPIWGALALLGAVVVVRSWVHVGLQAMIPLYLTDQGMAAADVQRLLSVFLLAGAVGTVISGPLADVVGRKPIIVGSMALVAPMLYFMVRASLLWSLVWMVLTGCVVVSTFSVATVMAQEMLPGHVGVATGIILGLAVGTGGIGATLLGWVADHWGVSTALGLMPALALLGLALALRLPDDRRRSLPRQLPASVGRP